MAIIEMPIGLVYTSVKNIDIGPVDTTMTIIDTGLICSNHKGRHRSNLH